MTSLRAMLRNPLFLVLTLVLAWGLTSFLIVPTWTVLTATFVGDDGRISLRAIERLLGSERAVKSLVNSVVLAVVLSVTVNVVGVFLVLVTKYYRIRGARILWLGYATTLVYGGIVQVSAYRIIYGSNGAVTKILLQVFPDMDPNWFSGFAAVVIVMTLAGTGSHLLFLTAALAKLDYQAIEAARLLGASAWTVLWRIVLPTLRPMIFAITILTFLGGLGALAAPQVLGGRDFQTITPMILSFANSPTSRDLAATLALLLGVATIVLLAVLNRIERGGVYFSVAKVSGTMRTQRIENPIANAVVHALAWLVWVAYMVPPVLIVVFSFTNAPAINSGTIRLEDFTLDNYIAVFSNADAYEPFVTSIVYGAVVSLVVIVLMLVTARMVQRYRNAFTTVLEYVIHLPWVLPGTLIALGLLMTFDEPHALVAGQVLSGTVVLLGIAYVVGKLPFTFRLLKAAFTSVPDHVEEAASLLGAGPLYTFRRVLLPLVAPTAAAITALNFNSLLDDYDSAIFLSSPFHPPLGIVIRNATSSETVSDTTAMIFVYTVLLMVISTLVMWLVYGRSGRSRRGSR